MCYFAGFTEMIDDVAIFDTQNDMENWISASIEKENGAFESHEPYYRREALTKEAAAMRLLVDPVELTSLKTVADEIYPGTHWIVFDDWEAKRCMSSS